MVKCADCGDGVGLNWWGRCYICGMKYMAKQGHEFAKMALKQRGIK